MGMVPNKTCPQEKICSLTHRGAIGCPLLLMFPVHHIVPSWHSHVIAIWVLTLLDHSLGNGHDISRHLNSLDALDIQMKTARLHDLHLSPSCLLQTLRTHDFAQ